jgi:hypothetical protein
MSLMAELQNFQNRCDALITRCSMAAAHPQA